MSNELQIRVDSRVLYGVVAAVVVVAIFVVGWLIGEELTKSDQEEQVAEVAAGTVAGQPADDASGAQLNAQSQQLDLTQAESVAQPVARGSNPVSVDAVPVGDDQPRLWIDELSADNNFTYDFGDIPAAQSTEKQFTISNLGTGELVIDKVSASCGCTAAVLADSNLGPGETTTLRVAYDPRVNGDQGRYVQKQVQIRSNDPVAQLIEFSIAANVASQ